MTLWRLVLRSALHYWPANLAVLAGVAVAAAVLVGSLVVGDSVNGSLHDLALERIGGLEYAMERAQPFAASIADENAITGSPANPICFPAPAFIADGTVQTPAANFGIPHVQVVATDERFFKQFEAPPFPGPIEYFNGHPLFDVSPNGKPPFHLTEREAAINQRLARELGVKVGDPLIIALPAKATAPIESVFGRRTRSDMLQQHRVVVMKIIPDSGLGRFTLRADRPNPRNIFISTDALCDSFGKPLANTLLVRGNITDKMLLRRMESNFPVPDNELTFRVSGDTLTMRSSNVVIPPALVKHALDAANFRFVKPELCSVYLANRMRDDSRTDNASVPYSILGARETFAGFESANGRPLPATLGDNEIVLNSWAADDLHAQVGDWINVEFFVVGPTGAVADERQWFSVAGVAKMTGAALDRGYVPELKGMTDSKSMSDWDPPFPVDLKRIRPKDEKYWDDFRATPKAFISLGAIHKLWTHGLDPAVAANTGWVTAMRFTPREDTKGLFSPGAIESAIRHAPAEASGFTIRNVRDEALAAANASTDFGQLFLSMSFFLVAAAAVLIFLLMRLTIDRRASEIGILLAEGFPRRRAARALIGEAGIVSVLGVAVGAALGLGYAAIILWALKHGWSGAVADFPLSLHVRSLSIELGAACALIVAIVSIWLSTRMLRRLQPLVLLSGWQAIAAETKPRGRVALVIAGVAFLATVVCMGLTAARVMGAAEGFALAGVMLLVAGLALIAAFTAPASRDENPRALSLRALAFRSLSRHRVRSLSTAALIACATLVIVTVAAFERNPASDFPGLVDSGSGGFSLMVRTDVPIFVDINTEAGRKALKFTQAPFTLMELGSGLGHHPIQGKGWVQPGIFSLRETRGDDVSCLNLQRSKTPRVVGVPADLIERGGFAFSAHEPLPSKDGNPWPLLNALSDNGPIPAFADADTAEWQMHVGLGDNVTVPAGAGHSVKLRIVGLMPGSIFAGELVISEQAFVRTFGADTGYRLFLVGGDVDAARASDVLRRDLADFGADVEKTSDVLASYARVQNTYLSAFRTLSALGLALGAFGVVAVLLRNVVERRRELAMMLALGFTARRVRALVAMENVLLLLLGALIGAVAALVASGPQLLSSGSGVAWGMLAATLLVALAVGACACDLAARWSVGRDVIGALRSE